MLALAAALAVAAAPAPDHKAGRSFAAFALPADDKAASASGLVEYYLRRAAARDPSIRLVDPAGVVGADADPARDAAGRAEALLADGKTAYENLDLAAATRKLEEAVKEIERAPAYAKRRGSYPLALLYLGASELLDNRAARAKDAFRRAAVFDPSLSPDPALFPDDVRNAYARARAEALAARPGTLAVGAPAGAMVSVDGVFRGVAPMEARVPPGVHLVRVERDGAVPFGARVVVRPERSEQVAPVLEDAGRQPILANFEQRLLAATPDDAGPAREMGRWLGVDRLIVVKVAVEAGVTLTGRVYDVPSGTLIGSAEHAGIPADSEDELARAADELAGKLAAAKVPDLAPRAAAVAVEKQCTSDEECPGGRRCDYATGRCLAAPTPIYKKWWLWAGAGGVVAAAVIVGLAASSGPTPPQTGTVVFTFVK